MSPTEILFDEKGQAISPFDISKSIIAFGDSYSNAIKEIIINSNDLGTNGDTFIRCAYRILKNFGMTRSGPFKENCEEKLGDCWNAVGADLIEIRNSISNSGLSRDRYLLRVNKKVREELIIKIWLITKNLLPFTMGETTYGLVGASKILFSVLPEIVLPIDNAEWLHVFKTVDIGDVLRRMVFDTQKWEEITGGQLNDLDHSKRLTTIPSVYNVMAMLARP
jgi:hypothetical protein